MSNKLKTIVLESIQENPLSLKEALLEELSERVAFKIDEARDELSEELNEISKSTLVSYIKKANSQVIPNAIAGTLAIKGREEKSGKSMIGKAVKRNAGIAKAVDRLAKEEFELGESAGIKSLSGGLNEISKATLGSYIKKAIDNKTVQDRYAGRTGDRESYSVSNKRDQGIKRAADKLTKEEVELAESADLFDRVLKAHGYKGVPPGKNETKYSNFETKTSALHKGNCVITSDNQDGNKTHHSAAALNRYLNNLHDHDFEYPKTVKEEVEQIDEAGAVVTHKWYSVKNWKDGSEHFDNLDDYLDGHDYKHAALGNTSRKRPDHHIGIPVKAKAAIAYMDKHAELIKEDTDINEVSSKTLRSYSAKAENDFVGKSSTKQADKRINGAILASKKLYGDAKVAASKLKEATSYEKDLEDHEPRVVSGVRGAKSTPFSKTFKNQAHFDQWFDKEGDNHEIHTIERK